MLLPSPTVVTVPIPRVLGAKNHGILVYISLSLTAQMDTVTAQSRGMVAFIKSTLIMLASHLIIPLYSTMVTPLLEYCV